MRSPHHQLHTLLDSANRILAALCAVAFTALVVTRVWAAAPTAGTITPTTTTPVTFTGTATATGAAQGESTCVDGTNCDTFTLTVAPGDYTGKIVSVKIAWTVPADDYDLYIHKGDVTGPLVGSSATGAPGTSEQAAIDPTTTGTGTYTVHVAYFTTVPADQYQGTATIAAKASVPMRAAYYKAGDQKFSPNVTVRGPVTVSDGEPSSRTDVFGNFYVGGIRGVPAGVDLWYFDLRPTVGFKTNPDYDPYMRHAFYQGQPDSFTESDAYSVGGDGGGDIDLAVGFGLPTANASVPTLAFSSLVAANLSTGYTANANSKDTYGSATGTHYNLNPTGNIAGVPVDDRQWMEFYGTQSVYMLYRTIGGQVSQIQRSDDGGFTYGPAITAGAIDQTGSLDVDQHDGTVYASFNNGSVAVGHPEINPATGRPILDPVTNTPAAPVRYSVYPAASDPNGVAHIFFPLKVADDGTVYVAYSNDHDIFLEHSKDQGKTWSAPVKVNAPTSAIPTSPITNVFPWIETGKSAGKVGIVWYGTSRAVNDDNADWRVYYSETFNATADKPTFRQVEASDHVVHASNISEGGLTGSANRNLLDYFQVSFDPNGAATIGYTDDHNDYNGNVYVTHQIGGLSINNKTLTPPTAPGPVKFTDDSQVHDFRDDVTTGLLVVVPQDDPLDILDIELQSFTKNSKRYMTVETVVSNLSVIPPSSTWRVNFVLNAPNSVNSPVGDYTFGVADRGDQFYAQAATDATGAATYTYGTVARNSDGSFTYTQKGTAYHGNIVTTQNKVLVQLSYDQINAMLPAGHRLMADGVPVVGIRGEAFSGTGVNAREDQTRGGVLWIAGQ